MTIRMTARKWALTGAALVLVAGLGAAGAQTPPPAPAPTDHSAHDHGAAPAPAPGGAMPGMNHGAGGHGGMGGMAGMGGMDHGAGGGMGGMGHGAGGGMNHGAGSGMGGMGHGSGGGHSMMKAMMCRMTEHVDGRLAYLKAELKLSETQTAAWNSFDSAFRAAAAKTKAHCDAMDAGGVHHPAGIVGELGMMEHHMAAHLESIRAVKAAVEPLLGVLSDEQKKTAELVFSREIGLGMGMMGH